MKNSKKNNSKSQKKENISKKNDGDEESKGFVEKEMFKENEDKIDMLGNHVSMIK